MFVIVCKQLQVADKDFNEGTKAWDDAIIWVDSLYVKYDIPHGIKDLFYSLIQCGIAKSVDESRILIVEKILKMEGLHAETIDN